MEIIGLVIIIAVVLLVVYGVKKLEGEANKPLETRPGSAEYYQKRYPRKICGDRGWREMCAARRNPTSYDKHMDAKHIKRFDESRKDFAKSLGVITNCRAARPEDYQGWLVGYLDAGGKITHEYDYDLPSDFYCASQDLTVPRLHGSISLNIIIPFGINVEYDDLGHNNLYFMDSFRQVGGWVPVYTNTKG